MRRMCHPDYQYQPWSDGRRERASILARRRVGALPGHRLLYGVQVPEDVAERVRKPLQEIARKQGRVAAAAFLGDLEKKGWPMLPSERPWSAIEARHLRELHALGLSAREISKKLNRTRNSILGKIYRSGLSKCKAAPEGVVTPPPGLKRVPAKMVWKLARDHMGSDGPEVGAAAFCIAPCFGVWSPKAISKYLGIPLSRAEIFARRMRDGGIWNDAGPLDLERYMAEGDEAYMTLVLDALVCLGKARRTVGADGHDLWHAA